MASGIKSKKQGRKTAGGREAVTGWHRAWVGVAVLALALAIGTWSRVVQIRSIELLDADATIAYLQSAGHAGQDWSDAVAGPDRLTERWVAAREWKALLKGESPPPLARIWRDHALDLHPPLYSILLGTWRAWFGQDMQTGIMLNIPLAVATMVALFVLALEVTRDHLYAALTAALYAVMPAALGGVSVTARMYELLALLTVLLSVLVFAYARSDGRAARILAGGIAVVTALGLLTHSLFWLTLLLAAAWLLLDRTSHRPSRQALRDGAWGVGGLLLGVALVVAVYPPLVAAPSQVMDMGGEYAAAIAYGDAATRLRFILATLADGVFGAYTIRWLAMWAGPVVSVASVALLASAVSLVHVTDRRGKRAVAVDSPVADAKERARLNRVALAVVVAALVPLIVLGFGFVTGRIPYFPPKYLAPALPFLAFVPWLVTRRLPRSSAVLLCASYVGLLVLAAFLSCLPGGIPEPVVRPEVELADASSVIVDTSDMSYLPKVLVLLSDDVMVFASESQDRLAISAPAWQQGVDARTHYVCFPIRGNTYDGGAAVAAAMAGSRRPRPTSLMPQGTVTAQDTATLWTAD